MSLQLLAIAGPDKDRAFTIQAGADLMIGRSQNAFYRVTDPRVSRNHCQLLLEGDRLLLARGRSAHGPVPESVVLKLLAKKPEERYQSAAEMLKELEKIGKISGVTV